LFRKISLSLIIMLFFSYCVTAGDSVFSKYDILDCRTGKFISAEQFEKEVLESDIIYSLESHNNIGHHIIQKKLAELVGSMNIGKTVLAHEFFIKNCYGHQELLDRLSRGEIVLSEFLDSVKYTMDRTKEFVPVFEIIAEGNIRPLAISIPMPFLGEIIPEFTVTLKNLRKKIFNQNWPDDKKMFPTQEMLDESYKFLTESEKSFLPRDGFKILCNKNLHEFLLPDFNMGTRHSNITAEEFHLSYWLMNGIMACSILEFLDVNKNYKMIVGTGINHGIFKNGIRASVAARKPELKQLTVLPTMDRQADLNGEFIKYAVKDGLADYILAPKKECEKNEISLPLPDGNFNLIREGSFGKMDLALFLMNGGILEEEALMATEGWVGDKFIFFADADMLKFFSIIKIVWNTEKDAEEFFNVYAKMSNNTMGEYRILSGKFLWEMNGFKRTVEQSGIYVEINAEMIVE